MQGPIGCGVWTMDKPTTKKQSDRRNIKCKDLVIVICEQWTTQQLKNKMIEGKKKKP